MKVIGYITATIVIIIYSTMMNGLAFCKLWAWFIAPLFEVKFLSIPEAVGVALSVQYLTHQSDLENKEKDSYSLALLKGALISTFKPLLALLFGAAVKMWL